MSSMTLQSKLPLRARLGLRILNIFKKGLLAAAMNPRHTTSPRFCLLSGHRGMRLSSPKP